jgi:hypothetical protein
VKGIGLGENWTQIEIERFNTAELEQLRGLLAEIAKETRRSAKDHQARRGAPYPRHGARAGIGVYFGESWVACGRPWGMKLVQ